ncbi:hypothetical protein BC829DRAFT_416102 [Chytridium lagenaria]|nr:hypothetical protein BC829DRAFT_416102 [Chytridium lagenaria]
MKSLHIGSLFFKKEYEEEGKAKGGPDVQTKKNIWWPRCQGVIRYLNSKGKSSVPSDHSKLYVKFDGDSESNCVELPVYVNLTSVENALKSLSVLDMIEIRAMEDLLMVGFKDEHGERWEVKDECIQHLANALMRFKKKNNKYRVGLKQKAGANEQLRAALTSTKPANDDEGQSQPSATSLSVEGILSASNRWTATDSSSQDLLSKSSTGQPDMTALGRTVKTMLTNPANGDESPVAHQDDDGILSPVNNRPLDPPQAPSAPLAKDQTFSNQPRVPNILHHGDAVMKSSNNNCLTPKETRVKVKVVFQVYGEAQSIRAPVISKDGILVQIEDAVIVAQRLLDSVGSVLFDRTRQPPFQVKDIVFVDNEMVPTDGTALLKAYIILKEPTKESKQKPSADDGMMTAVFSKSYNELKFPTAGKSRESSRSSSMSSSRHQHENTQKDDCSEMTDCDMEDADVVYKSNDCYVISSSDEESALEDDTATSESETDDDFVTVKAESGKRKKFIVKRKG